MPPKRILSSRALRCRTAWFPVVLRVEGGVLEVHVCWKYVDGSVGLFSNKAKTCKSRPPWDYIKECKFRTLRNDAGEEHDYFILHNRGLEKKAFRLDELNPILWTMNDFTSKMIELRTTGRKKLLALYLSLVLKSSDFSGHVEGTHDQDGFQVDGSGLTQQDLKDEAGSLKEYRDFVRKAKDCCLDVHQRRDALEKVEGGKSVKAGGDDFGPTKVKRSKAEQVEDEKEKELMGDEGVEKNFSNQYVGRAEVPLDNLTISTKVSMPIIQWKVHGLVKAMSQRYDPSLMSLTVIPVENTELNSDNLANCRYEVIHGRHR